MNYKIFLFLLKFDLIYYLLILKNLLLLLINYNHLYFYLEMNHNFHNNNLLEVYEFFVCSVDEILELKKFLFL